MSLDFIVFFESNIKELSSPFSKQEAHLFKMNSIRTNRLSIEILEKFVPKKLLAEDNNNQSTITSGLS